MTVETIDLTVQYGHIPTIAGRRQGVALGKSDVDGGHHHQAGRPGARPSSTSRATASRPRPAVTSMSTIAARCGRRARLQRLQEQGRVVRSHDAAPMRRASRAIRN